MLAAACLERVGYRCERDAQCDLDGREGRCQVTGYCAYPDAECPSGLRYEPNADAGLADRCVPRTDDTDTDSDSDSNSDSDSDSDSSTDTTAASDTTTATDTVAATDTASASTSTGS